MTTAIRTAVPAGAGLLVAGGLMVAASTGAVLPVRDTVLVPLHGWGWTLLAALVHLAAVLAIVLGSAPERRLGPVGRVALVLWGAGPLVFALSALLPPPDGSTPVIVANAALAIALAAAGLVGAAAFARGRLLPGPGRWALVPTTVAQALLVVIMMIPLPIPIEVLGPLLAPLDLTREVLLMLAGAALLAVGRLTSADRREALPQHP